MIETLLEVRNLKKTFRDRTGWFRRQTVEAVKPLSFTLREGQTLAIIGENGSGKSTLAKMLAGMIEPTSGELLIWTIIHCILAIIPSAVSVFA